MVDVCSLCDSVTYPLGSGGDHGYLAESLNDLRQAGPAGSRIAGAGVQSDANLTLRTWVSDRNRKEQNRKESDRKIQNRRIRETNPRGD